MIQFGQHKLPSIQMTDEGFVIHNYRNLDRKYNDYRQVENYEDKYIWYESIENCWLYVFPFMFGDNVSHIIVWFETNDGEEICISRESQLEQWKDRSVWNYMTHGYRAVMLWWSVEDMIWLRDIRNELKCNGYKIRSKYRWQLVTLLKYIIDLSNHTNAKITDYKLFSKNCASSIWSHISKDFGMPKWTWRLILTTHIPKLLQNLWYIYHKQYKISYDSKYKKVKKSEI